MFDSLPAPDFYIKKNNDSNIPDHKEFKELLASFNYEKITNNEESISKWLKIFKNILSSSFKCSLIDLDCKSLSFKMELKFEFYFKFLKKFSNKNIIGSNDNDFA